MSQLCDGTVTLHHHGIPPACDAAGQAGPSGPDGPPPDHRPPIAPWPADSVTAQSVPRAYRGDLHDSYR
jgi:hypothetical protein